MSKTDISVDELMQQAQSLKADDPKLMEKMQEIAEKVAAAKRAAQPANIATNRMVDPADELGCEGCQ